MSKESKYLLVGLQDAGKTTFLAALWYLVQPNSHPTALVLERLEGNSKYLNQIRKDWLEYKKVPRTYSDSERVVSMCLQDRRSSNKMTLQFPDLAGESFENQWATRQWTKEYQRILDSSSGALLFLHPDTIKAAVRIDQVDAALLGVESAPAPAVEGEEPTGPILEWDRKRAPTQVQLVEILQFIRDDQKSHVPFRLAVIVSAWDRISDPTTKPLNWVQKRLPLLAQFLKANPKFFEAEFFGISAQGGVYAKPKRDVQYDPSIIEPLADVEPFRRIKLVGDYVEDENDITAPLKWMMR